ncbi:MAG: enoyl-CoA hydratase/isomerase family protein [Acidobacteriota bacterium]
MSYTTIEVQEQNWVRRIRLNRPERRNAMTPQMQTELIEALDEAAAGACRVVVLEGAGEAFCSGLDLSALQAAKDKSALEHREDAERVSRLFRTLYESPKATIAAVHGAAIAGGTGLATICDFTLATPEARFGYSEVRIGFVPALVSAYLVLQIGEKRARDLLLTGRVFDAAEGHRLGLVTEVVAAQDLAARVQALAQTVSANSPASVQATKKLLAAQSKAWLDEAIAFSLQANATARETADFQEGVAAFLEKRRAQWS